MSNHSTQRAGEVQLRTLLIPLSLFRFLFFLPFFDERHTFRCSAEAAICHSAACLSLDRSCTPSPNPEATQSPWGSLSVPLLTTHCLSTCPGGMEPPPAARCRAHFQSPHLNTPDPSPLWPSQSAKPPVTQGWVEEKRFGVKFSTLARPGRE